MDGISVVLVLVTVLYGIFLVALPFLFYGLSGRVATLEASVRKLTARIGALERPEPGVAEEARPAPGAAPPQEAAPQAAEPAPKIEPERPAAAAAAPAGTAEAVPPPEAAPAPGEGERSPLDRLVTWIMGSLTLARVGVVVLLFGVGFLLRYAAEHGFFPIELRLAGSALGGLVLLGIGWRLRTRRHGYAMILQGGGIGIVYLTVFAAVSMYELLPAMPGQALMVVLVALAAALAVLQNSQGLALFAVVGGFLAPVLISRGGSHVVLFSYYAILDAGILGMAWFRAWRALNLAGFAFTFVIGSLWGYRFYQPEFFATTEPFLVLFFLFYVAVAVLYALRRAPDLEASVDGTLVFGVPLVSAALQAALVRDFEYGLAWSAFGAGVFYVTLAAALWIRRRESLRLLVESFLALGIAFGTLAIPYAVDPRVTAAAWALEGAALVWVGVRQGRLLARLSGLGLQVAAGAAFLLEADRSVGDVAVLNSLYLSGLMVALGGLISAYHLYRGRERLARTEPRSAHALVWGLLWWFGAGLYEVWQHAGYADAEAFSLLFVAASAGAFAWLERPLHWPQLRHPPVVLLPFMVLTALFSFVLEGRSNPFERWGLLAWPLAFAVQYALLWRFRDTWRYELRTANHMGTPWLALFVLSWELVWQVQRAMGVASVWPFVAWLALPALALWVIAVRGERLPWPLSAMRSEYMMQSLAPIATVIGLWVLYACFRPGDPSPLPYVPVINPLELMQLAAFASVIVWSVQAGVSRHLRVYFAALAFVVLNGIVARATHFLGGVDYAAQALYDSALFQVALSITWTVLALALTVAATRRSMRNLWFTGASLLALVVVKLFLVDLAEVGTIARIVSFIVVGLLILLVAYLSPLPPEREEEEVMA